MGGIDFPFQGEMVPSIKECSHEISIQYCFKKDLLHGGYLESGPIPKGDTW
jgi:hypothetical protein